MTYILIVVLAAGLTALYLAYQHQASQIEALERRCAEIYVLQDALARRGIESMGQAAARDALPRYDSELGCDHPDSAYRDRARCPYGPGPLKWTLTRGGK